MAKSPTPQPLEIPYFNSGFYTYRSQLFAPFRSLGVNIISYHDPVLAGADMECTDLFEWQQRPGYTQFCNVGLNVDEIINQFYSARALNGTLLTMFDSNQRLATFTPSSITTIFEKTTTSQGFINQVGDTTYFYDGTDAIRYDQIYGLGPNGIAAPTSTVNVLDTGGWLADTPYAAGAVLLDYNGNIEYAANVSAGTSLLEDNTGSIAANGTYWETVNGGGQWRTTGGATSGGVTTPLNAFVADGMGFNIPSTAVILGVQVVFGTVAQSTTGAEIVGASLFYHGAAIGSTRNPGTPFLTVSQTQTYGISTDTWGASLTPAIVNDPTFGFGLSVQLGTVRVFFDAPFEMRVFYFIPSGTGGTAGVSGSNLPNWSALPGSYTTDGTMRWNILGPMGQWLPGIAYTIPSVILDTNNNLQQVSVITAIAAYNNSHTYHSGDVVTYAGQYWTAQATVTGTVPNANVSTVVTSGGTATYAYNWIETPDPQTSGATVPVWNTTIGGQTNDGSLVWTNIGPGNILVNAGYSWGVCYRTMDGHLSTMSVPVPNQGTGPLLGGSPLATSDISSFSITSNIVTFICQQTFTPGERVYVQGMLTGTYLNDQVLTVASAIPSASYSITSVSITSNVVTFTANNSLATGEQVTIQGLSGASFLNGQTLTVIATGLTSTAFEANFTHANYGPTADNGTAIVIAQFTAGFTHANVASTPDVGTVNPVIAQLTGTGTSDPRLIYSTTITEVSVTGNLVTLTCDNIFFPGNTILVTGLSLATFLNDFTLLIATATPTYITAYFQTDDYPATADAGIATFEGIEIYRTADGGGIWYQVGVAQPNTDTVTALPATVTSDGLGIPWSQPAEITGTGNGAQGTYAITNVAITSNVVTFTTTPQAFVAGQAVVMSGVVFNTALNGQTLTVLSSGLTSTSFSANFTHANVSSMTDAGFATSDTNYTFAVNNPYVSLTSGQYVAYGTPSGPGSGGGATSRDFFGTPFVLSNSLTSTVGFSGASLGLNSFTSTLAGYIPPTLPPGATVVGIYAYATGANSNNSGSFVDYNFSASWTGGGHIFALNGSFETATLPGTSLSILSSLTFTNFVQATTFGGSYFDAIDDFGVLVVYTISGGTPPTTGQLQTLEATNFGAFATAASVQGIEVRIDAGTISTLSPPQAADLTVQLTLGGAPVGTVQNVVAGNWATDYILGNSNYLWGLTSLTGSQISGGSGLGLNITGTLPTNSQINLNSLTAQIFFTDGTWTFVDIYGDTSLNEQLVAPIAHLNDPPPGQLGSIASPFAGGTLCAYWQGRQWLAQGQFLYFDAGQDCINGDPHQSWPPGNRFEYPGTIVGIAALDNGLVVLGADYFGLALGGPQTLTFYPLVISKNFGISSPNAMYQDGQTLHILTTQGQMFEITNGDKENEGQHVADYIAGNFPPATSYLTLHRNGNDVGLFMSNGSTQVLRYGSNIGAWSVPAWPVGGVGALASIETSIGTYSLCMAPPTVAPITSPPTATYIMARNLNAWADMGGPYTSTYALAGVGITIGSITLSGPGAAMAPLQHIIGYFDATGVGGVVDQPAVAILPNEIYAAGTQTGFITIPSDQVVPEPPPPAALVSTSLQSLRFPVNMMNSIASQYMHHLQLQITYPSTNAPHTIKALALKFNQGE